MINHYYSNLGRIIKVLSLSISKTKIFIHDFRFKPRFLLCLVLSILLLKRYVYLLIRLPSFVNTKSIFMNNKTTLSKVKFIFIPY